MQDMDFDPNSGYSTLGKLLKENINEENNFVMIVVHQKQLGNSCFSIEKAWFKDKSDTYCLEVWGRNSDSKPNNVLEKILQPNKSIWQLRKVYHYSEIPVCFGPNKEPFIPY
jgi:hypothetical protein